MSKNKILHFALWTSGLPESTWLIRSYSVSVPLFSRISFRSVTFLQPWNGRNSSGLAGNRRRPSMCFLDFFQPLNRFLIVPNVFQHHCSLRLTIRDSSAPVEPWYSLSANKNTYQIGTNVKKLKLGQQKTDNESIQSRYSDFGEPERKNCDGLKPNRLLKSREKWWAWA